MWVLDHRGGLVNLDNAVWIGVTSPRGGEDPAAEALLSAHMVDGTSITLAVGTAEDVAAKSHDLQDNLRYHQHGIIALPGRTPPSEQELEARMRHED